MRLARRLMSDQLTPVQAYRRLVAADDRTAPSFLLESVETGGSIGRFSFLGAQPAVEVVAFGGDVRVVNHVDGSAIAAEEADPLRVPERLTSSWTVVDGAGSEGAAPRPGFTGGWVGYAGYDTVRAQEPEKLPFAAAPPDDRGLPDLHFGLYRQVVVFDHVDKVLWVFVHVTLDEHETVDAAYDAGLPRSRRPRGPARGAGAAAPGGTGRSRPGGSPRGAV